MRTKFLVWLLMSLMVFPVLSFAQMKPQIPAKTYYCAKVEDVLINPPSFSTADMISVGVRVRFTKQTYIPGAPGQKLCDCAFEGPSGAPAKFWSKTMSLRLIGIKYSETETNLLEYYGPTPSFPSRSYSGFQVIGFTVTEADLKEGIKDVWGWSPRENPLKDNREFKIYVTLDVNGFILKMEDDPDYLKKGCFPSGDFVKSFKPREPQVPKVDLERIKEVSKKSVEHIAKMPDLQITQAEIFPKISKRENEQAVNYAEAQIRINIQNTGRSDVPRFKVKVERKWEKEYYPERGTKLTTSLFSYGEKRGEISNGIIEIGGLKAGGSIILWIFVDNSFAPKADCWFRITLDPDNEVTELDESNNVVTDIFFPNHYTHPEKYGKKKEFKPAPAKAK